MKSLRMLLLLAVAMTSVSITAVNVEKYLTGKKVDAEGKTFLHKLAENCDNDDFQIELMPFKNDIDKKLLLEVIKLEQESELLFALPPMFQALIIDQRVAGIVMAKDNNDETALDILKRKNAIQDPCARCVDAMKLLQEFHDVMENS